MSSEWRESASAPFGTSILLLWEGGDPPTTRHREIVIGSIPVNQEFSRNEFWNGQRGEYESMEKIIGWMPLPSVGTVGVPPAPTSNAVPAPMGLAEMLALRKELDPDAPDMIALSGEFAPTIADDDAYTLSQTLWAAANFISAAPDRRPPEERAAVLKFLDWAIERYTVNAPNAVPEQRVHFAQTPIASVYKPSPVPERTCGERVFGNEYDRWFICELPKGHTEPCQWTFAPTVADEG